MKLIIVYRSRGIRQGSSFDSSKEAYNGLVNEYCSDGYSYVFQKLIDFSIVDEVLAVVESRTGTGAKIINDKHKVINIPHIEHLNQFVEPDDIFFVRGAMRHHVSFFEEFKNHKIIFYGAGVNRASWPYWNVVMHEKVDKPFTKNRKKYFKFYKPINPSLFYPTFEDKEYDLIVGSSFHIYDRKGQYKAINAIVEYKKMYNKNLKVVLPGKLFPEKFSYQIPNIIKENSLDVKMGFLSRYEIASLLNKSKIHVNMSSCDQEPRSSLEAMSCGTPIFLHKPSILSDWVQDKYLSRVCTSDNPKVIAIELHKMLKEDFNVNRVVYTYKKYNGIDKSITCLCQVLKYLLEN